MQMIAVGNDARTVFKFYVEVLYGAGNRAIAMPPRITYTQKAQACEAFQRQMLRAAACGRLVRCTCFTHETLQMPLGLCPCYISCTHCVCKPHCTITGYAADLWCCLWDFPRMWIGPCQSC